MTFQHTHPFKLNDFNSKMERGRKRKNEGSEDVQRKKQVDITTSLSGEHAANKSQRLNSILRFIVGTGSPFSIVEHPDFGNLLNVWSGSQSHHLPNRKQIMDELQSSFLKMKEQLKTELKQVTHVCATADCWTVFKRSYIGMTVHWLNPETLERNSKALSCRRIFGRHTYDILADAIESILDDYCIKNKTTMIVTDNGSNFVKAFRLFAVPGSKEEDEYDEELNDIDNNTEITHLLDEDTGRLPPHHCCASHTLNLLATTDAQNAMDSPNYKRICRQVFAKCQGLFNKQNKSSLAAEVVQKHLGRYLIVPGATRWNSHFDALQLLRANAEKLDAICNELDLPTFKRPQDMQFLDEYCTVMQPVANALDILQGEKGMFLGYLLPTLAVVKLKLQNFTNLQYCQPLKEALLSGFEKRFERLFRDENYVMSACLMPRFKLTWAKEEERDMLRKQLTVAVRKGIQQVQPGGPEKNQGTTNAKAEDFFALLKTPCNDSSGNSTAEAEVVKYLFETNDLSDLSVVLRNLFITYNTTVPSSAHCERLFSSGGLVFSERRGRMTDKNFEMALLLKFNGF